MLLKFSCSTTIRHSVRVSIENSLILKDQPFLSKEVSFLIYLDRCGLTLPPVLYLCFECLDCLVGPIYTFTFISVLVDNAASLRR